MCKKCNVLKPPRTHHCPICRTCVVRMDHHCPWVLNCVGYRNHRYFALFLFWIWVGCIYIGIMTLPQMIAASKTGMISREADLPVFLCFVFSSVFSIVLFMFAAWQYYLIMTGQSQFEFYDNAMKKKRSGGVHVNEFDLGYRQNFNEFFGVRGYWWTFMLPTFVPPSIDEQRHSTYSV